MKCPICGEHLEYRGLNHPWSYKVFWCIKCVDYMLFDMFTKRFILGIVLSENLKIKGVAK
jgi:hypothetical protein